MQHGDLASVPTATLHSKGVTSLAAPADIWERIRRGYAIPDLEGPLVHQHEQWYLDRPDYLTRMTERSRMYLFHIVEELQLRGMPTELALLPYIESGFNPRALSSAKAAGLWQFIPSTGKDFDLRQNALRDDRRNIIESTRAALDFLQQLHDQFGDWQLALAAYNWGPGNVQRAIAKNEAAGLGTSYSDLDMPAETRNYVPKLQAVKNIIGDPKAFAAELPDIGNHPYFDIVTIKQDIDVAQAARLADVSLDDFKALNPSQHKPIIFAAGTPQILLPWRNAEIFQRNLARTDPASLASWTTWVAPRTMTPAQVASDVGMTEEDLRQINNIPRNVRIRQGSTLLVARQSNAPARADQNVVDNAHVAFAPPENTLRRTLLRAQRGDTIATLAQRYDLPAATVARWNKARPGTHLAPGRSVVVYLPAGTQAVARTTPSHTSRQVASRHAGRAAPGKQRVAQAKAPTKAATKTPVKVAQKAQHAPAKSSPVVVASKQRRK